MLANLPPSFLLVNFQDTNALRGYRVPKVLCASDSERRGTSPATQFAPLTAKFSRRITIGSAAASAVAVGGNLGGITSFILGLQPNTARTLRLDCVYPVLGFKRCVDSLHGFEFVYPSYWVGDTTLLYRAAERAENERTFGPPKRRINEPVVAFGPPGTNGELNVSVVVSPVPANFSLQMFGEPTEAGEAILSKFIVSKSSNITATLLDAKKDEKYLSDTKITYYYLEYSVKGPSFSRHNVAVYTASPSRLFTLNGQCPESAWPEDKNYFFEIANSFKLLA